MPLQHSDIYLPYEAKIVDRQQESPTIFTLTLEFTDPNIHQAYQFIPGQFNMLYLFGVGEVAISVVSGKKEARHYAHTIRRVGRVTNGLSQLNVGETLGVRGPFGRSWPLEMAHGKDILIITGGSACAASVSLIYYIEQHRDAFGKLMILQGVKHSDDFIFRPRYERWAAMANTQVLLAADVSKPSWPWHMGLVTELIDQITMDSEQTLCMMCGPEGMMLAAVDRLSNMGLSTSSIYLSLERNMECAVGHCGHCQLGGEFICKDGPVFCYDDIKHLLGKKGF